MQQPWHVLVFPRILKKFIQVPSEKVEVNQAQAGLGLSPVQLS